MNMMMMMMISTTFKIIPYGIATTSFTVLTRRKEY
jgi:hypothetical protein